MIIKEIHAKAIKDSRNIGTIEISVNSCKASSPSGTSSGKYETKSYRKSLNESIKDINNLKELRRSEVNDFSDLIKIEEIIKKKFKLKKAQDIGANVLVALEFAILKALAKSEKKELWQIINPKLNLNNAKMPFPVGNAIGGGEHSRMFKIHPVFQEFELIPQRKSIKENVKLMQKAYNEASRILKTKKANYEGALQSDIDNETALRVLFEISKKYKIKIGLDIAASTFYDAKDKLYYYNNKVLDKEAQINYIFNIIKDFDLFYIEDPVNEEDFNGFSRIMNSINRNLRTSVLIVGDDLTATHIGRLKKAVKAKAINALIVKPNQNGSLLELKEIIDCCKKNRIKTILSHRSGETLDDSIADLAFAWQCDFIKFGISTKWRRIKLKRLIEIEKKVK